MLKETLVYLGTTMLGIMLGAVFNDPIKNFFDTKIVRPFKRMRYKKKKVEDPMFFTLGGRKTSFLICDGDGEMTYAPDNIETRLNTAGYTLPEELSIPIK